MSSTITLALPDDVRIVVPNSLDLITPYVLQEQQDWFEDEIKFLRRLLQPGSKVIDIGANYGVYTLTMARRVGPAGSVWAFEPASATAQLLSQGIAANGFSHVVLNQSALSSTSGTAQLSLSENSELNALVRGKSSSSQSETVPLMTLDECMRRYDWHDIAFVKIDAEGEETNILKGGARFFSELSPLVQYEIKAGADLQFQLMHDFAARGYDSYRLVPGLDLLIPFHADSPVDGYLLNLFCCKPDRAELLARQGFLVTSRSLIPVKAGEPSRDATEKPENRSVYNWRQTLAKLPYGLQLADLWEQTTAAGSTTELEEALSLYALSRDTSRSPAERFHALEASFKQLFALCARQPSHPALASLARVARDYGARSLAVEALNHLNNSIHTIKGVDLNAPFLAPCERFDLLPPGEVIANWFLASVFEALERLEWFSSYYPGDAARQRLRVIRGLGFGSEEMERRLQLVYARFGQPAAQSPA